MIVLMAFHALNMSYRSNPTEPEWRIVLLAQRQHSIGSFSRDTLFAELYNSSEVGFPTVDYSIKAYKLDPQRKMFFK